ncbi:unnamed protein product, partial [Pylaiella littoralis]
MATNASSSDYVFFLQGGEVSCAHNPTLCAQDEDETIPALLSMYEFLEGDGLLSGDPSANTRFSTYNRIFVPYCSMDMFLLGTESDDGELQFRGRHLLEETLRVVLSTVTASNANVVLGGSTAGGVGAFNIASWLLETFDQARLFVAELSVIVDSAFLFDVHGYMVPFLGYLQSDPSAAYSSHCSEEFDGGPCCLQFACMVQKGYYPADSSSAAGGVGEGRMRGTFALSGLTHPLQAKEMVNHLGSSEVGVATTGAVAGWEASGDDNILRMTDPSLRNLASLYPSASCSCIYGDRGEATGRMCEGSWNDEDIGLKWGISQSADQWDTIQVDGVSVRAALEQWWSGRGDASEQVLLIDDCDGLGCNPSCPSELLLAGDRDDNGTLVMWVVVLTTLACAALVLGGGCLAAVWGCLQWRRMREIVSKKNKKSLP